MVFYIYEIPGRKNGATIDFKGRSEYNFNKYNIQPILIETMEGPDVEEFWQVVGDREWELADLNGYDRGTHYRVIRIRAAIGQPRAAVLGGYVTGRKHAESGHIQRLQKENCAAGGKVRGKQCRLLTFEQAQEIRSKYVKGSKNQHSKVGPTQHELAKQFNTTRTVIKGIVEGKTYLEQ